MRVLAIAINMFPNTGWGRYALAVGLGLAEKGVETKVLTYKNEQPALNEKLCKEYPLLESKISILSVLKNSIVSRKLARDVDIVHAFDVWPFSIYGYAAVLGTKRKLFVTGVGTYSVVPMKSLIKKFFIGLALHRAKKIFSVSKYTKKRMLEMINLSNIEIVPWGSPVLQKVSPKRFSEIAKKFVIADEKPLILTVGQIKERKGHLDVIKAVEILKEKYPKILYCLVGSDKNYQYVALIRNYVKEHKIERNIKIVNNAKTDEDLAFFYEKANVFVMMSNSTLDYFEGFGLVFLEAEQFGKPVVGSSKNGTEEALKDGYNGYVARQRDSEDIADKISKILDGKEKEFGANSIEFQKQFKWGKTVESYLSYYNE